MRKFTIVLIALFLAACANKEGGAMKFKMTKAEALGAGVGAVIGGAVGYQFGSGLSQALFSMAGTVAGGAGGYVAVRRLAPSDQAQYTKTAKQALSNAADGETLNWSNPKTGASGIFKPTRSFRAAGDNLCRDYRAVVALEREVLRSGGTACRMSGGDWLAFNNAPG
ncbi:MAG TPA: hypothetical protein ENI79_02000 [Rhodospirillales bacterium]|nr:hypothetical protein [Rhodospirillales bacterium]